MDRPHSVASYALALFALLWLGVILITDLTPTGYGIDASLQHVPQVVTRVGPVPAAAGLHVGDVIHFGETGAVRRYGRLGDTVQLHVARGSRNLVLRVPLTRPLRSNNPFVTLLSDVGITFALLLAAYLGFRKPSVTIAALILFLGGGALNWTIFTPHFSALPDALYVPFASVMAMLCEWFPVMALASFAVRLPGTPPSKPQRTAIRIVDVIVAVGFVFALLQYGADWFANGYVVFTAISGTVVLLASVAALALSRPADRGRAGIVFGGVMIGGVGYALDAVLGVYGIPDWLFVIWANISVVTVSLAIAYAVLKHRVFDVAFVLNRTIVFAVTSALVLVVFAALEFLVERFLSDVTHVEGILVQFGIALVVTLSVGLLHRRADFLVDTVLFRARHEQERALRRFASTLQFYTEEGPLVRDTVDVLLRYGRVEGAAMYLAADTGLKQIQSSFSIAAPEIEHNDMAYVEMRAHHEPLLVHKMPTALPGDRLYPMVRAGRIVGVVATGERESGEEMPPDIDDAIVRIAHAAATSLGAIESDLIRAELTSLRTRLGFSQ